MLGLGPFSKQIPIALDQLAKEKLRRKKLSICCRSSDRTCTETGIEVMSCSMKKQKQKCAPDICNVAYIASK